jgi:hypothetical protein
MHRRSVDRLTATLMFADRNRMSAFRRKVPLTSFATALPRHSAAGDRACNGGSPAHRPALGHLVSDPSVRREKSFHATISAQRNPASSLAMAAATTLLVFLRSAK